MNEIIHIGSIVIAGFLGYCLFTYEPNNNSSRLNQIRYKSYELRSSIKTSNTWIERKGVTDQTKLNEINQYSNDLINLLNEYKDNGGSQCMQNNEVNEVLDSIRRLNIAIVNTDNLDAITANGIDLIDRLDDLISRVDKYFREGQSFLSRLSDHIFSIVKKFNIIQLLIAFCFGGFIGYLFRKNESTNKSISIKSEAKKLISLIRAGTNENRVEIISTKNNLIRLLSKIDDCNAILYTLEDSILRNDHPSSQNVDDVVNTLNRLLEL